MRYLIDDIVIISFLGSLITGIIISLPLKKFKKELILLGFCSSFTSFSAFVKFFSDLIINGKYFQFLFYLNVILALNLLIMYFGYLIGKKRNNYL